MDTDFPLRYRLPVVALLAIGIAVLFFTRGFAQTPSAPDPYLTTKGGGNHLWYAPLNIPAGYYSEAQNKTYLAFHSGGVPADFIDPLVMSYNHTTGTINGPVKVGENILAQRNDFHGNPSIIVDDAGYIHVVYGGHGGEEPMKHAVSVRPGDISEWEHLQNIDTDTTYPCLVKLDDGRLFLFYRDGGHHDNWVYVVSRDNGRTFAPEKVLTKGDVTRNDGKYYEGEYWDGWYGTFRKGPNGGIHHITKYHAGSDDWGNDYHGQRRTNLYYARFVPGEGWQNLDGKQFKLPLTLPVLDKHFRIFDAPIKKRPDRVINVEVNDVAFDHNGRVYIGYRFGQGSFNHRWRITRLAILRPRRGFTTLVVPFGSDYDTMGKWGWAMDVQKPGSITVYGEKIRTSKDNGFTWTDRGPLADVPLEDPITVRHAHPEARLMIAGPRGESPYRERKVYLWGENGFITPEVNLHWDAENTSAGQTQVSLTAVNRSTEDQESTITVSARSETPEVHLSGSSEVTIKIPAGGSTSQTRVLTHPEKHGHIYLRARPSSGSWTWADFTVGANNREQTSP